MGRARLCLDLSRLLSRVGRGPLTGVDRVERAYADWVLAQDPEALFLSRTSRGFILFGAETARRFLDFFDGRKAWPRPDMLSRLTGRGGLEKHGAEALLRQGRVARSLPGHLARMLSRHFGPDMWYLNVGHSNLTDRMLSAVQASGAKTAVFLHDVIPIEFPEFSSPGLPERFGRMLARVEAQADLVLCNSKDTQHRLQNAGITKPILAAHLGVHPQPEPEPLPFDLSPEAAHFLALGTIEPRKNLGVLLQAWSQLPTETKAHLHIVGRRGWESAEFFRDLDTHPLYGKAIFEHSDLSDGQVQTLMTQARALLFPTLAEGFGLPVIEAARAGLQPICSDLPVLREILDERGVYLDPRDGLVWLATIKKHSGDNLPTVSRPWQGYPTWQAHFETVAQGLFPAAQKEDK